MHCAECQWAGNTLDVFSKLKEIRDIPTAIKQAVREGVCTSPQHVNSETIQSYIRGYPERRAELLQIWRTLTANVSGSPRKEVLRHLQQMDLWSGYGLRYRDRLAKIIGAATKAEIKKAFGIYYKRVDRHLISKIPENGFNTALVLNYQDAPGRICAFELLDSDYNRLFKSMPGSADSTVEGGLSVLDLIKPFEPVVVMLDDPKVWLALHKRRAIRSDSPLNVLLYNQYTNLAWRSVTAEKSIFWAKEVTVELFQHARKVANGCIVTGCWYYTPSGIESKLGSEPVPALMGELNRRARTWPEVLVEWVTDRDRTESEAIQAFETLSLTPGEREAVISVATPSQQHRLNTYIGAAAHARSVTVNGATIIEQNNGWQVARTRGEEAILDGVIHIDEELCDQKTGVSYMRGMIKYRGKEIGFIDPTKEISRSPGDWLTKKTIKQGLGSPHCNSKFAKQLLDIARAFSNPRIRTISTDLGIVEDGSIVFPKFVITGGAVQEADNYNPDPAAPMTVVMPPLKRDADTRDTTSLTRSATIAIFCAMAGNWLDLHRSQPNRPVAVVGGYGSVAWSAMLHFASIFGLPSVPYALHGRLNFDAFRRQLNRHSCHCMLDRGGSISGFPASCNDRVYLRTDEAEYASLRVSDAKWIAIYEPSVRQENNPLPPADDFIWYLADLQRRQYALPGVKSTCHELVEDFCRWYEGYLDRDQSGTAQQALQILRLPATPGEDLLKLIVLYVRAGLTGVAYESLDSSRARLTQRGVGITVDEVAGKVFIAHGAIMTIAGSNRLPMPDLIAASQDLRARNAALEGPKAPEGWTVSLEAWKAAQTEVLRDLK